MNNRRWQSKTVLAIALGIVSIATVPLPFSLSAIAAYTTKQLARSPSVLISAGTTIPVRYEQAEKIVMTPRETVPVTLTVAKNIRSEPRTGRILIPAGSQVKGELKPVSGGTQFVAQQLILTNSGRSLPIDAVSEIVAETKTIDAKSDPDLFKNVAVGAGAGAVLGGIFGRRVHLGQILAGAGIGAGVSELERHRRKEAELIVIDPDTDLHLTLQADLVSS